MSRKPTDAVEEKTSLHELCRRISALHRERGGTTIDPVTGKDWFGEDAYAVSLMKPRERVLGHPLTPEEVFAFMTENWDLLSSDGFVFGSWRYDEQHYMDVSTVVLDLQTAIRLGHRNGQACVCDLATGENIWTRTADGELLPEPMHGGVQPERAVPALV